MLLSLQKVLALLVMPMGLLWLLLLGGAVLTCRRRRWRLGLALMVAALLYGAAGNIHLGAALLASLERQAVPVDPTTVQPFDVVFVLGGGSDEDPLGRPELGLSGDRVAFAARLWHAGRTPLLVASGCSMNGVNGFRDGGQETRALWLSLGVPDRAILVVQEPCWITREEIAAYRSLQAHYGWRRMGLVSSAWHLPRAMGLAGRAGLTVTPLGADWLGRRHAFQVRTLVPQAEGFLFVQLACWEYLGRWVGR